MEYKLISKQPTKCWIKHSYFTENKKQLLNVYFALQTDGVIFCIIGKKGMGLGGADLKYGLGYMMELSCIVSVCKKYWKR